VAPPGRGAAIPKSMENISDPAMLRQNSISGGAAEGQKKPRNHPRAMIWSDQILRGWRIV
jgi:hypothetical protein